MILCVTLVSCNKDYSVKPSPFAVGDKVDFKENNFRKQFDPVDCCDCPCIVDKAYTIQGYLSWYYDVHDTHDFEVYHVNNTALRKYPK